MKVHLDTDLGGDPDDACALVMLLGWPGVEIVGITTNLEVAGRRAGCVSHILQLAGRTDIPVVAGAGSSLTTGRTFDPTWGDERYWPTGVSPKPSPPGAALDLLEGNASDGATVVAIGVQTNLALLEVVRPGSLSGIRVVAMGGWLGEPGAGLPRWGPERDWNVQCDTRAAEVVAGAAELTLVTMPVSMRAQLRGRDLPRLRSAGAVGSLLARQSEAYADDSDRRSLAAANRGLPDDLVNFHWDPVTCAAAVGWPGAEVAERFVRPRLREGVLDFRDDPEGRPTMVTVDIDAAAFGERWLRCVEAVGPEGAHSSPG